MRRKCGPTRWQEFWTWLLGLLELLLPILGIVALGVAGWAVLNWPFLVEVLAKLLR